MKVYIVNYFGGNRGVYASRESALHAMTAQGFDASTRIKLNPWYEGGEDWLENGWYDREEYRIEEWEVVG